MQHELPWILWPPVAFFPFNTRLTHQGTGGRFWDCQHGYISLEQGKQGGLSSFSSWWKTNVQQVGTNTKRNILGIEDGSWKNRKVRDSTSETEHHKFAWCILLLPSLLYNKLLAVFFVWENTDLYLNPKLIGGFKILHPTLTLNFTVLVRQMTQCKFIYAKIFFFIYRHVTN